MMRLFVFLAYLALSVAAAQAAAPLRPYGGCGVLTTAPSGEKSSVVLYREPGVARLAEVDAAALPRLQGSAAEPLLAVSARKGEWTRVGYDDAGREGWLKQPRSWRYRPWQEFLPGRTVRVLPGMKKPLYGLKSAPGDKGREIGSVSRDETVRVLRLEEDWALLEAPSGWFRWRDGDGRLTISLQE